MIKIVMLVLAGLVSSCSTSGLNGPRSPVEIATYDVQSGKVLTFNRTLFKSEFPDGVPITSSEIQRLDGRYFLTLAGSRAFRSIPPGQEIASCRTTRMALDDAGQGKLVMPDTVETQSCAGVNCSSCDFAPHPDVNVTTGCVCLRQGDFVGPLGYCNHTITRTTTRSFLRLPSDIGNSYGHQES